MNEFQHRIAEQISATDFAATRKCKRPREIPEPLRQPITGSLPR